MKKNILFFIFILFFSSGFSQKKNNYFFKTVVFGSSFTYIPAGTSQTLKEDLHEFTWNLNGAISLHKRLLFGIQVLTIFNYKITNWNNYYIYGIFSQFDFIPKQKIKFFAEISINKGNYFVNYSSDPYFINNLLYIGFGLGSDIPLIFFSDKLFLDLSFYNYLILNKINDKSNYTQYIIGINYHFGKKIK